MTAFAGHFVSPTFQGGTGMTMVGASVTIYIHGSTTKATLYTDRTAGSTTSNPFTATTNGVDFFAVPGRYDVSVSNGSGSGKFTVDVLADSGEFQGLTTATGSLYFGAGVPPNAYGNNGDIYFRTDGGSGTCIYQRRSGTWTATGA